ncbi:Putative TrbL/VirB6 plasmid conjugal transfer protein [Escherichia coli]|nr:Putative TrbL/VirB6 plasmid conjugal transfer protein [Escherichia coli]
MLHRLQVWVLKVPCRAQPLWGLVLAFSVHPVWRVAHLVWAEMPVIGAWKGLRRQEGGFGQSPGITGKTANLAGQGVNIGAKKLRQAAIERAKKMYGG